MAKRLYGKPLLMLGLSCFTLIRMRFEQEKVFPETRHGSWQDISPHLEANQSSSKIRQTQLSRALAARPQAIAKTKENQTSASTAFPLLKGLNASQILQHFQNQPLQYDQIPNRFPKPSTTDHDMVAIYSKDAWFKLRHMLTTRQVTLLVSGGSSMTGAGVVDAKGVCQQLFADAFYNVTVVDRAHGGRNSFHSMQLMHSFFPQHTDVIIWEFAINDGVNNAGIHKIAQLEQRNQLILFLDQVARVAKDRNQEPPLVILLYLWTTPFTIASGWIDQHDFDSHRHLGETYDFVVGQVNAARYVMSWQLGEAEAKAVALSDDRHPNARGQMILAYLLIDFVTNTQRLEKPKEVNQTRPSFTWACGVDAPGKRLVRNLLEKRHPVASFTEELPKNDVLLPGMLSSVAFLNTSVEARGPGHPLRRDRQRCAIIPCCGVANMSFDVSHYSPIQGIHANLSPNINGATVFFDGENVTNKFISAQKWKCLPSISMGVGRFLVDWVVLKEERNVSSISFCNHVPTCGTASAPRPALGLMSMAVYGGKR
jgi:hypothetical protein